ncbi:hypothetical protein [Terricaulis sp.]|uniref:hypothetical protein n=1 Tax=Terricaulis sp. TaxID=2768686 RepID=UPI003784C6D0
MRMFAIAAMAMCLTGAAAYADPDQDRSAAPRACERVHRDAMDADEVQAIVERAMAEAREAIRQSELDAATAAEIEAQIQAALDSVDARLDGGPGVVELASLSAEEQQAIEARVEAAMAQAEAAMAAREVDEAAIEARVEAAMARAEAAMERARRAHEDIQDDAAAKDDAGGFKLDGGPLARGVRL